MPKVWGNNQERQAATAQEGSREELPHVPTSGATAERNCTTWKVRGPAREELPHLQGVAVAQALEGQEELLHVQGQERRP